MAFQRLWEICTPLYSPPGHFKLILKVKTNPLAVFVNRFVPYWQFVPRTQTHFPNISTQSFQTLISVPGLLLLWVSAESAIHWRIKFPWELLHLYFWNVAGNFQKCQLCIICNLGANLAPNSWTLYLSFKKLAGDLPKGSCPQTAACSVPKFPVWARHSSGGNFVFHATTSTFCCGSLLQLASGS